MAAVVIGVDRPKGSHAAVVISVAEQPPGEIRVRASKTRADELVAWAVAWPERTRAVEGAGGLGRLLARQLVAASERVLGVQPGLGSRVRLLQAGDANKNDPGEALSVAVAALRSKASRDVTADDYPAVLKVWSRRHRDLARTRNQVACRLRAVLCDLVPGGVSKEITAAQAAKIREQVTPSGAAARAELAADFPQDLRHVDAQLRDTRKKLAAAVRAPGTSLTEVSRAGPVIAGTVIGDLAEASRFPRAGITSPPVTAPPRPRCRRGTGRSTGCHRAATGAPATPSTWPPLLRTGTGTGTATAERITTRSWPTERRIRKRSGASSTRSATPPPPPGRRPHGSRAKRPGRQPPNGPASSPAGSHPAHRLSG